MNLQFGSGVLFGIPNAGNTAANPTPTKFGVLQEVSVEFKGDLKKLYGQKQFPVAKARGKLDVTLKGKMAVLDVDSLNQLYFGQVAATGVQRPSGDESHATASSITPTHAVSGSAITILSVQNGSTGATMTLVAVSAGGWAIHLHAGQSAADRQLLQLSASTPRKPRCRSSSTISMPIPRMARRSRSRTS
jgi:hypothetical protein